MPCPTVDFSLGLAPGFRTINERWYGVPHGRPAPHMKECIQVTRAVIEEASQGTPVRFEGKYYDIDIEGWSRVHSMPREHIPIYVGAMREGMCRMAGDVADGLMPHSICSAQWIKEVMLPNVNLGLERSGRKREDFDFSACLSVAITERQEAGTPRFQGHDCLFCRHQTVPDHIFVARVWSGGGGDQRDMFLEKGYGR